MTRFLRFAKLIPAFVLTVFLLGCDDDDDGENLPQVSAGFTQTIDQGIRTVTFINTSENATKYAWDFGDSTTSTEINPIKTYESGEYTVTLTASNTAGGTAAFEDTFTILAAPVLPITFDDETVFYQAEVFNGAAYEVVANPDESGSNAKAGNVASITNIGAQFEGIALTLGTPINLSNGKSIEMNFWSNEAIDVLLKLEVTPTNAIETAVSHGGTGWEALTFDFDSFESFPRLVIFVDGPGDTKGTFYFDDVTQGGVIGSVPTIGLLGDAMIEVVLNGIFTDPGVMADDVEDGDLTGSVLVGGDAVDVNTEGTYIITYNVTDSDGNQATEVTRTVIVALDETPPVITLNGDAIIDLKVGDSYTEQGATATDNIDGDITEDVMIGGDEVDTNTDGTYVVTYNVSDNAGNAAAEVTRIVNVTTPNPFCNTQIQAHGGDAGSDIFISVFNVDDQTMRIEIVSADDDPVDDLIFPAGDWNPVPGISLAPTDQGDAIFAGEFFYNGGAPEIVEFNILWSKESFGGNWSQNSGSNLSSVRFDATCDTGGGGGCTGTPVAATTLPVDFEGCETFLSTFGDGSTSVTAELAANPDPSGINTSASVLKVDKPTGTVSFSGFQNEFPANAFGDLSSSAFKLNVYSTLPNITFRFEVSLVPQTDPPTGNPAQVYVTVPNANEWTEVTVQFINLPDPDAYNLLVIKPDNPESRNDPDPVPAGGTYYFDDIRIE